MGGLSKPRPLTSAIEGRALLAYPFLTESKRQLWALPLAGREASASDRWYRDEPTVELLYPDNPANTPSTQAQTAFSPRELEILAANRPDQRDWRQTGNDRIGYTPNDARRLLAILAAHLEQRQRAVETIGPRQRLSPLGS